MKQMKFLWFPLILRQHTSPRRPRKARIWKQCINSKRQTLADPKVLIPGEALWDTQMSRNISRLYISFYCICLFIVCLICLWVFRIFILIFSSRECRCSLFCIECEALWARFDRCLYSFVFDNWIIIVSCYPHFLLQELLKYFCSCRQVGQWNIR